jgi:hypothetical protein
MGRSIHFQNLHADDNAATSGVYIAVIVAIRHILSLTTALYQLPTELLVTIHADDWRE